MVQVINGAGHHVYADRAREFNSIVESIGNHADAGTLPPTSPDVPDQPQHSRDAGQTITNMINVRHDYATDQEEDGIST